MQIFVEGSTEPVELVRNVTITDADLQESLYLTQATVGIHPLYLLTFIPVMNSL